MHHEAPLDRSVRNESDAVSLDDGWFNALWNLTAATDGIGECGNQEIARKHFMFP